MKTLITLLTIFLLSGCISQTADIMPLEIGSRWEYFNWYDFNNSPYNEENIIIEIVDTADLNWFINGYEYRNLKTYIANRSQIHDDIGATMPVYYAKDDKFLYEGYNITEKQLPDTIFANRIWPLYPEIGQKQDYIINLILDNRVSLLTYEVLGQENIRIEGNYYENCWKIQLTTPFTRGGQLSFNYFCPGCGLVKSAHAFGEQTLLNYKSSK